MLKWIFIVYVVRRDVVCKKERCVLLLYLVWEYNIDEYNNDFYLFYNVRML